MLQNLFIYCWKAHTKFKNIIDIWIRYIPIYTFPDDEIFDMVLKFQKIEAIESLCEDRKIFDF